MGTRKRKWGVLILAVCLCWVGTAGCGKQTRQQEMAVEREDQTAPKEEIIQDEIIQDETELIFGEFRTNDTEYREVTQDIFSESDVTMVYIWATFSEQCITELGQLAEISAQYQEKNVENSTLQAKSVENTESVENIEYAENTEYESSAENTGCIQHAQKRFQIVGIPIDTLDQSGSASSVQIHEIRKIMKESQADFRQILPSYHLIVTKLKEVTELPEIVFVDQNGYQLGESRKGFEEERNWNAIIDEMIAAAQ